MLTIWKFTVQVTDRFTCDMPDGAKVLTVQNQAGDAMMWALVDPSMPQHRRTFRVIGTGHPIDESGEQLSYIGTFQMGRLVFHLFEDIS